MSLTLYSSLVSFVSNIIFSMKFKAFHMRKANSGFVDEVNIGKEAIFDVYDTSTSLSVSESRECNREKKKHRKCDFFYVLFVFLSRAYCSLRSPRASFCSSEKHEKCRQFYKVTRNPRALRIFIVNN